MNEQVVREMDPETAMFVASIIVVILAILTGYAGEMMMAAVATMGLLYIVGGEHFRKMLGYLLVLDLAFGYYLLGLASATQGGFIIAACSGLLYTVVGREVLLVWGSQRLAINGKTKLGEQFAEVAQQTIAWGKAIWNGLKTGKVEAPEPMQYQWMDHDRPQGFKATRTYGVYKYVANSFGFNV